MKQTKRNVVRLSLLKLSGDFGFILRSQKLSVTFCNGIFELSPSETNNIVV